MNVVAVQSSLFEHEVTQWHLSIDNMIIFAFADYEPILANLQFPAEKGSFVIGRFANGELFVRVGTSPRGARCVLLGSIAPPDERLLSLALLAHTLKKEGCLKVTALVPYLAYSRQDKDKAGESLATAWTGSLLMTSGVDEVFTIDVHSERDKLLFPIPLTSVFPAETFARAIREHQLTDATIVAPDNGAVPRCVAVNNELGRPAVAVPYLQKKRDQSGIKHTQLLGSVASRVLIIDDILDTGGTLISACEKLLLAGAIEIYIMVTHGLFTGTEWKRLWSLGVQRILCTDTVPLTAEILNEPRINTLSIAQLLKDQVAILQDVGVRASREGS